MQDDNLLGNYQKDRRAKLDGALRLLMSNHPSLDSQVIAIRLLPIDFDNSS